MTHEPSLPASPTDLTPSAGPWYQELTRYHWFVLFVAALGWMFDCLDQNLFTLARPDAMADLLSNYKGDELDQQVKFWSGAVTSIFMIGWASGGLFFGVLGDRIGRTKTMLVTILLYSGCTGLSALSTSVWDFAAYRFLTGLGVGGEFAVGVALVAEVMPNRARPFALTLLQALSAFGNISAALVNLSFGIAQEHGAFDVADGSPQLLGSPWRLMFLVGALPALLAVVIRLGLKEPEQWQKAAGGDDKKQLGSYRELFGHPVWRRNALIGLALACSGVIGLWAVGFFTPDLTRLVLRPQISADVCREELAKLPPTDLKRESLTRLASVFEKREDVPAELAPLEKELNSKIKGRLKQWGSYTFMMINVGAFFGMFGFGTLAQRIGRRPTFAIALILAFASTICVFWLLQDFSDIFWMVPIMGFCQLSLFAGYAMYFPELFPTHLRSTGTSFCYNVGRFVAAAGPLVQGHLNKAFEGIESFGGETMRPAGMVMSCVFLIGLFVLPFAPETKDKPLPE